MLLLDCNLTLSIQDSLSRIEAAGQELDPYIVFPYEFSEDLRRAALAESVHYSTAIEGNTLTLEQVEAVLAGTAVSAPRTQVQEAENYRDAMSFIQSFVEGQDREVTEETIRTIQFLVSKNLSTDYRPGRYRTQSIVVADRLRGIRVFFPPPPERVGPLMAEFGAWLNSHQEYPAAVKAALAHLNLVAIHPFADGNGRTARLIETLVMYLGGNRSQELVSLESYYGCNRPAYYAALASTLGPHFSPPSDVTPWLEYNLRSHATQAEATVERANAAGAELHGLANELAPLGLSAEAVGVLRIARRRGRVTNRDYRRFSGRSSQDAISEFNRLVGIGLLARVGRGRSTAYVPSESLIRIYAEITAGIDG